jgi:hypothetical protein
MNGSFSLGSARRPQFEAVTFFPLRRMLHEIGSRQNPIGASQAVRRRASFRSRFERIRARGFRAAGD